MAQDSPTPPNPTISKITLPSGTTYDLKDASAREAIAAITGGYTKYIGVTTTALTDGSTTNPIVVNSASVTATTGDIATYQNKEFIWNGSAWQEFGDLSGLGALAYKDSASGSFTPSGGVSAEFVGENSTLNMVISINDPNPNYTPSGTVSQPTFSGSAMTSTGTFTPSGSVALSNTNKTATVSTTTGTATYTPGGTVSQPTFSGSATASTGKFTPSGSVALTNSNVTATVSKASSGTATYTPEGSVSTPTITVTPSTTTVKNPTSVTVAKTLNTAAPGATAPSNPITYYSVAGETLSLYQIGYTTGASITTSDVSVLNGITSATSTQPTFTGTGARLVTGNISVPSSASFTGTEGDVSVSGTPSGTVSQPTFTGTGVRLVTGNISVPSSASFTGTEGNISVSGTPSGTVSQPTFTGTGVKISGGVMPKGYIDAEFEGTEGTVTVS